MTAKKRKGKDSLERLGKLALDFHRWTVGDWFEKDVAMLGAESSAKKMNREATRILKLRALRAAEKRKV